MSGCCQTIAAAGNAQISAVEALLATLPASADVPPQLEEGMTGLLDIPTPANETSIGAIATSYQGGSPAVWQENWVVSTEAVFTDASRTSRLRYASPQPAPPQPRPSGSWEATMTFSYLAGNSAPAWPNPGGTVQVLDVYNGAVGSMTHKGRLFRRHNGSQTQDWWLLYPGYVKPTGTTCTELRPKSGTPADLWGEARTACAPSGGMYVPIQYTRAQIP